MVEAAVVPGAIYQIAVLDTPSLTQSSLVIVPENLQVQQPEAAVSDCCALGCLYH